MSSDSDALAFMLEPVELRQIFAGWPDDMHLAVCLDSGGDCAMLVYHCSEAGRIFDRIATLLNLSKGSFCVIPAQPGFPSRRILFSEEQTLISLVAETESVVEAAQDYALNYAFAAEEGFDVELLTTGVRGSGWNAAEQAAPGAPGPDLADDSAAGPLRFVSSRRSAVHGAVSEAAAEKPLKEALAREAQAAAATSRGPGGFHALTESERRGAQFGTAMLSVDAAGQVWLSTRLGAGGLECYVDEIFFRDDLLCLALPIAALRPDPKGQMPARIGLDPGRFPASLLAALRDAPQSTRMSAAEGHIYISLEPAVIRPSDGVAVAPSLAPNAVEVAPAPARFFGRKLTGKDLKADKSRAFLSRGSSQKRRIMRWLRGGLGGGAVLLALLVLAQLGLSPAFSRPEAAAPKHASLRDDVFGALASAVPAPVPEARR